MTPLTSLTSQDKQATLGATRRRVPHVGIALATAVVSGLISRGDPPGESRRVPWGSALVALLALGTMPLLNRSAPEASASR